MESKNETLRKRAHEAHLFSAKGYLGYVITQIRQNSFYQMWKKFTLYFRRIGLVSVTLQIVGYIFVLVQSGFSFVLLLFTLPILFLVSALVYLIAGLCARPDNRKLTNEIKEADIFVFFPSRTAEFSHGTFWKENIRSFAQSENSLVFVVSPYFFSGKGTFDKHRFYLNYIQESPRIYLVRKHYYFSLRRIFRFGKRVTLIY